jgi:nitrite reductase/ring-hydroxylating ferredoxin subunit
VRVPEDRPKRYPWWQLILLGLAGLIETAVWPFRRMWSSPDPIDRYALMHLASATGDALVAIALANSIFFEIPVGQAQSRVAAYLLLTMAPLAVAGPALVPLLDRAGPRRAISVTSAAGRAFIALFAAPRVGSALLYPATFLLLVLSRAHSITKNGLVLAYAGSEQRLVRANARLGRFTALGAVLAAPVGVLLLWIGGSSAPLYLASAVYATTALLNLRLPPPRVEREPKAKVARRGRIPELAAPAFGAASLRMASGFLLFLLAFALRRDQQPAYWFGVLVVAGLAGALFADLLAPRVSQRVREEIVVVGCVLGAGIGAFLAFQAIALPSLVLFGLVAGAATELGRLAFQSLVQRHTPAGAFGRVFVRYEVIAQLSWVVGALIPALTPIGFRGGVLALGAFYLLAGVSYLLWPRIERRFPSIGQGSGEAPSGGGREHIRTPARKLAPEWPSAGPRSERGKAMGEFVTVGQSSEVGEDDMKVFDVAGNAVAVARVDDTLYAFSDICTHRQCNLMPDGLDGTEIECECHGSVFDITSGAVVNPPAPEPIATFEVREEGSDLQVSL